MNFVFLKKIYTCTLKLPESDKKSQIQLLKSLKNLCYNHREANTDLCRKNSTPIGYENTPATNCPILCKSIPVLKRTEPLNSIVLGHKLYAKKHLTPKAADAASKLDFTEK